MRPPEKITAGVQNRIGPEEIAHARHIAPRILEDMAHLLAAPDEIPVSKGVRDRVAFLLSGLTQGETSRSTLAEDIVDLGPAALSVVLENGYKVHPQSREFELIAGLSFFGTP